MSVVLSGKYVFAPIEVFRDQRLGLIELRVLLALYSFRGSESETEVFPRRETIMERCGYSKTTISRAVTRLVKHGWIEIKQHRGPNTYKLKLEGTVTNSETVTEVETVTNPETVTEVETNSDRSGQETVTDPATPELTKNKHKEQTAKPSVPHCPHAEIIDLYHDILPELKSVLLKRWKGSNREKLLATRWKEDERHQDLKFWTWFFQGVRGNSHWMGNNGREWKADLGWLLKRDNFDKAIEHHRDLQQRANQ